MRRAFLLAAALACLAPASAHATFPGRNGRIAFVRPGEGIYTVKPDGSSRKPVTPAGVAGGRCDTAPAWAPSGLELAFQTCDPARHSTAIGVMDPRGAARRIVVRDTGKLRYPQTPAFAPGGARLAFAAGAFDTRLFSIGVDGRGRRALRQRGYEPAWSRAGLAYSVTVNRERWCNSTQLDDVYALNLASGVRRRLTRNNGSWAPDWAPDGRHVAYTRDYSVSSRDAGRVRGTRDCKAAVRTAQRYGPEVVVAEASGKSAHRLTQLGGSEPSWSPDGTTIAFERAGYIWTMTADGHLAQRITKGTQPAWQPAQGLP